jgi:hypothetical protein
MHRSTLRRLAVPLAAALILWANRPNLAVAQDDTDAASTRADFSAQIVQLGQDWLRSGTHAAPGYSQLLQGTAMFRGAVKANPNEPRYQRLLATALQQLNDTDGQIAAWDAYRRLVPEDRVAAARVIELYVSKMNSNEEKIKYLKSLTANAKLAGELRAHLAWLCAELLHERSDDEAAAIVADGLKLYPLPELLDWQYNHVNLHAGPVEKIAALLGRLHSNPIQPWVIDAIAVELANQGMAEESAGWFATEMGIADRMGIRSNEAFYFNLAAELYLAGQNKLAQQWVAKVLEADPGNISLWFLSLSILRGAKEPPAFIETAGMTREALSRQWSGVVGETLKRRGELPKDNGQPITVDPLEMLQKVRAINDPKLNEAFALSLENIVWFAIYYQNNPKALEQYLAALEQALPADDMILQRLKAWTSALNGKDDEARALFSANADRDPLAALGLIRLDHGKKPDVRARLRELLAKNPAGVAAVCIHDALLDEELPANPATRPATAPTTGPTLLVAPATEPAVAAATTMPTTSPATVEAIRAELAKFPPSLFFVVDQPQRFYTVTVEPVQSTIRFGDPLLARATLTNRSDYDLVIGYGGPLASSLWFDAKVVGIAHQDFPAVAFDQISGPIVLRGHATSSQIVRIDQGSLGELMVQRANGQLVVSGDVMTNPASFGQQVMPSAGGEYMIFSRSFVRLPSDVLAAANRRQLSDDFANGTGDDRMHDLQLMGSFIAGMDKDVNPKLRDAAEFCIATLAAAKSDAHPEVAASAGYLAATLPGIPDRLETVQQMLGSANWQSRLLGLAALRQQPVDVQQQLSQPISEKDPEPAVKQLATGLLEALKIPATQPTTQPSTAPATQPASAH